MNVYEQSIIREWLGTGGLMLPIRKVSNEVVAILCGNWEKDPELEATIKQIYLSVQYLHPHERTPGKAKLQNGVSFTRAVFQTELLRRSEGLKGGDWEDWCETPVWECVIPPKMPKEPTLIRG